MNISLKSLESLRQRYPKGTIVELFKMDDFQAPPCGTRGVVENVDDTGTIHVHWQTGSSLGLIPDEDEFLVISRPA